MATLSDLTRFGWERRWALPLLFLAATVSPALTPPADPQNFVLSVIADFAHWRAVGVAWPLGLTLAGPLFLAAGLFLALRRAEAPPPSAAPSAAFQVGRMLTFGLALAATLALSAQATSWADAGFGALGYTAGREATLMGYDAAESARRDVEYISYLAWLGVWTATWILAGPWLARLASDPRDRLRFDLFGRNSLALLAAAAARRRSAAGR